MKRILTLIMATLLVFCLFAGCGGKKDKNDQGLGVFSVGYAKVDITPSLDYTLPLCGNNDEQTRVATGVLEPLFANCVAMTDTDGNTVILYGMDIHGIGQELLAGVRAGITEKTGIEGKFVQMTGSHTHQGPPLNTDGYGYADAVPNLRETVDKLVQAAVDALADRKAATMSTAFTRVENTNYLRYYRLEDGTVVGNPRSADMAPYYNQAEKTDDLLQLVKFDRQEGKDIVLINWQAHYRGNPDGDYTKYCSDYMGVMRNRLLDQADCESVFLLGASGNLASLSNYTALNTNVAESYITVGENLAKHALLAMEDMTPAETGKITLEENIYHIQTNKNDYNLYTFGVGDVGFCMMPYEPFQSLGMKVRDESPYKMTLIGTCANGNGGNFYLPDADAYGAVNAYGVSKKYVQGDEMLLHTQYIEMLNKCFEKGTVDKKEKAEGYITDTTPYADPTEYLNPNPGNGVEPVKNGLYRIQVVQGTTVKVLLIDGKDVAQQLDQKATFKVLMDNRNIVVGIQK